MHAVNPSDYFNDCHLRESRVLGFAYNDSTGRVRLDVDYAAEVVSHWFEAQLAGVRFDEYQPLPSDFRRFTFFEAAWLHIDSEPPLLQRYQKDDWVNVLKSEGPGLPVIAAFEVSRPDAGFTTKIEVNQRTNHQFAFTFRTLSVQRRLGRNVLVDEGRSLFQDVDNRAIFSFHDPFPNDR